MLVTVTNTSGVVLNDLAVHEGGSGATGGARALPLPYPFGHIGAFAIAATKQLPMHSADWLKQEPNASASPREDWNQLVQSGKVTLAVAAQADAQDSQDAFVNLV